MEIAKDIIMVVGLIFTILIVTVLIVGFWLQIKKRLNLVHRLDQRLIELERRIVCHESYNQDQVLVITKFTDRVEKLECNQKEIELDIEWLKEASAEIRFEVFNKGTKSKRNKV